MKSKRNTFGDTASDPDALAIATLGRLAADPERIERFLAITGLDAASLRAAARAPGFLSAVLDHVLGDEPLLMEIAGELGSSPEAFATARAKMRGSAPSFDDEYAQ